MTKTNEGLMIGKFVPMHKGHKFAIMEAAMRCHHLTVVLCIDHKHDPKYPSPEDRVKIMAMELNRFPNITIDTIDCTAFPYAKEDDEEVSKYWSKALYKRYPSTGTLFGSEKYVEYMARNWPACNGVRHEIIDLSRRSVGISATEIRNNPITNFEFLVESAKPWFTKHVLVIGSESCGKSTLVQNLSKLLKAPYVPEMYRSMFPEKGMDFTAEDLLDVAKIQNQATDCQVASPFNKGIVIHDTCNDVTRVYAEKYYPNAGAVHRELKNIRDKTEVRFDLILFCDIDVPWEQDGTRTIGGEDERKEMRDIFYSLANEKANMCNCPMVVLPPDYKRLPSALDAIEEHIK